MMSVKYQIISFKLSTKSNFSLVNFPLVNQPHARPIAHAISDKIYFLTLNIGNNVTTLHISRIFSSLKAVQQKAVCNHISPSFISPKIKFILYYITSTHNYLLQMSSDELLFAGLDEIDTTEPDANILDDSSLSLVNAVNNLAVDVVFDHGFALPVKREPGTIPGSPSVDEANGNGNSDISTPTSTASQMEQAGASGPAVSGSPMDLDNAFNTQAAERPSSTPLPLPTNMPDAGQQCSPLQQRLLVQEHNIRHGLGAALHTQSMSALVGHLLHEFSGGFNPRLMVPLRSHIAQQARQGAPHVHGIRAVSNICITPPTAPLVTSTLTMQTASATGLDRTAVTNQPPPAPDSVAHCSIPPLPPSTSCTTTTATSDIGSSTTPSPASSCAPHSNLASRSHPGSSSLPPSTTTTAANNSGTAVVPSTASALAARGRVARMSRGSRPAARVSVAGHSRGQSRAGHHQNRGPRRGGVHRTIPTHPRTIRCLLHGRLSPCLQCGTNNRYHPYRGATNNQSRQALQEHYRAQPVQQPRQVHSSSTINLLTTNMIMQAAAVKINVDFNQLRELLLNSEPMV